MAIAFTQLANSFAYEFSNTVEAPGTVTPSSANVAMFVMAHTFTTPSTKTFSGLGLTWTEIPSSTINIDGDQDLYFFVGVGSASAGIPQITGDFDACAWSMVEVSLCNFASPRIQTVLANGGAGTGTGTSTTVVMAAFENALNAGLMMVVNLGGQVYVPETGDVTEVYSEDGLFGGNGHHVAYGAANDNSLHMDWNASNSYAGIGFEIDEAAAGGGANNVLAWIRG